MWAQPQRNSSGSAAGSGMRSTASFTRRRRRPSSAPAARGGTSTAARRGRRLMVERSPMLHETRITETHSAAAIISNVPRWGLGTELEWRRRHPNQHARSAWQLRRPATAAGSRSAAPSGGDGGGGAEEGAPEDYFARLSTDGAHRLDGEQLRQRQKAQIFGVVRRAMAEKRQLFGTTVGDTQTFFETADADGSGSLDRFEFRRAMRRLGIGLTAAQVEQLLAAVDSDRSGDISYAEFVEAIHEPEPEPEPEAAQAVDAAASMLQAIEGKGTAWEHERPWPEALCPAPGADASVAQTVGVDGSVLHERSVRPDECELSRDERHYRATNAARLATPGGLTTLRLTVTRRDGANETAAGSAAQGRCYLRGPVWRLELAGAGTPGISTRRADGSRPPRMVVRELLKAQGWLWNKMGRCWFLDVPAPEGGEQSDDGDDGEPRRPAAVTEHVERLLLVALREGLEVKESGAT